MEQSLDETENITEKTPDRTGGRSPRRGRGKAGTGRDLPVRPSTLLLLAVLLVGVGLLLYPTVSNLWNRSRQTRAIETYSDSVSTLDPEECAALIAAAEEYNRQLFESGHGLGLSEDELEEYESQLRVEGTSIIGYIEIDKIDCYLPICLGTDEGTLQNAVGHLEGSSLPVGGESTHSVLSGHRGLPSARLFTDLDLMEIGDTFVLHILDQTLTYEVDQILTVLPTEVDALAIEEGKDYCTLLTCTPYGVNSHRLLVRGHRVANAAGDAADMAVTGATGAGGTWILAAAVAAALAALITVLTSMWYVRKLERARDTRNPQNPDSGQAQRRKKADHKESRGQGPGEKKRENRRKTRKEARDRGGRKKEDLVREDNHRKYDRKEDPDREDNRGTNQKENPGENPTENLKESLRENPAENREEGRDQEEIRNETQAQKQGTADPGKDQEENPDVGT